MADTTTSHGDDMLTAQAVSEMTGVPVSTLHSWAAKRAEGNHEAPGPRHIMLSPRHRRWYRRDVEAWIETSRV
ncbi:helix-turn-helix transcriptional regulator [Gordonia sihwensis]|uniref:helix-turn-helix transcriptional regulator n=1 Tax=Gordonia sihwensis TaxID=173559 RepID=UPI003D97BC18